MCGCMYVLYVFRLFSIFVGLSYLIYSKGGEPFVFLWENHVLHNETHDNATVAKIHDQISQLREHIKDEVRVLDELYIDRDLKMGESMMWFLDFNQQLEVHRVQNAINNQIRVIQSEFDSLSQLKKQLKPIAGIFSLVSHCII